MAQVAYPLGSRYHCGITSDPIHLLMIFATELPISEHVVLRFSDAAAGHKTQKQPNCINECMTISQLSSFCSESISLDYAFKLNDFEMNSAGLDVQSFTL